jgi:type II secretory pathway component PulL
VSVTYLVCHDRDVFTIDLQRRYDLNKLLTTRCAHSADTLHHHLKLLAGRFKRAHTTAAHCVPVRTITVIIGASIAHHTETLCDCTSFLNTRLHDRTQRCLAWERLYP